MEINNYRNNFEEIVNFFKNELSTMRIGRANPVMVENILVESYGVKTPLKGLASINVSDARTILIEPWDKNIVKDIEKAVIEANIGFSPVNEGKLIRINLPQLTAESRQKLVKLLNQKREQSRIKTRGLRDEIKDEIIKLEKNKEITEDDKYDLLKKLDEFTKSYNEKLDLISAEKEKEITTI